MKLTQFSELLLSPENPKKIYKIVEQSGKGLPFLLICFLINIEWERDVYSVS